mmetsp:Transcript_1250/g.4140  ORF Transcript_1250/g.4140 Transcript_1250/m.4140 type:complete len:237 (+) Transcript_1250:914-1624(+)
MLRILDVHVERQERAVGRDGPRERGVHGRREHLEALVARREVAQPDVERRPGDDGRGVRRGAVREREERARAVRQVLDGVLHVQARAPPGEGVAHEAGRGQRLDGLDDGAAGVDDGELDEGLRGDDRRRRRERDLFEQDRRVAQARHAGTRRRQHRREARDGAVLRQQGVDLRVAAQAVEAARRVRSPAAQRGRDVDLPPGAGELEGRRFVEVQGVHGRAALDEQHREEDARVVPS